MVFVASTYPRSVTILICSMYRSCIFAQLYLVYNALYSFAICPLLARTISYPAVQVSCLFKATRTCEVGGVAITSANTLFVNRLKRKSSLELYDD